MIVSTVLYGIENHQINNSIKVKQSEISEINMYRDNIKDIDDKYTNLLLDIYEKDYEIYQSIENMEMNEFEAINIMKNYAHIAFQLFVDFIRASDSKYFVYVDYNILHEFRYKSLQPWWSEQPIEERTWNIIFFEVLISENDNITEYLYKRTPWGELDLNNFLKNESEFGTIDLVNLINETRAESIFWYNKTWEILYNYTQYGVLNINVDLQLYDRIVQKYYEEPLLTLKNRSMNYDIQLTLLSASVLLFTFLFDILIRKKPSKKKSENNVEKSNRRN
ncbi:MAG: hypothetical protein ACFE91_07165 [Promethearchaeota archaeon]